MCKTDRMGLIHVSGYELCGPWRSKNKPGEAGIQGNSIFLTRQEIDVVQVK